MVTMEDISIELGCSINTVSKALNNKPDVSPKTRQLVLETARRMGYVPNSLAKSLVTRSSGTLGIVVPSVTVSFYAELVETVMKGAAQRGYSTFLALSSGRDDTEIAAVENLYQKRTDGLIIIPSSPEPSYYESLQLFKVPAVYVLNDIEKESADFVGADLAVCSYRATQHLIDQGCRRLALLCSIRGGIGWGVEKGFLRCLEDNGLGACAENIFKPSALLNPQDAGYEIAQMLDDRVDQFDGLVLEHEQLYFGIDRLLDSHGISCPRDILVAASIGMGIKRSPFLSLTSVEVNPQTIGLDALELLLARVQGKSVQPKAEKNMGKLVIRRSSRR